MAPRRRSERVKKEVKEEPKEEPVEVEPEPPQKGPRRSSRRSQNQPRLVEVEVAELPAPPSPPSPVILKKKRGRKSKTELQAIAEAAKVISGTGDEKKKRRGRKRKQGSQPSAAPMKTKRGQRGRKVRRDIGELAEMIATKRSAIRNVRRPPAGTDLTEEQLQDIRYNEELQALGNPLNDGLLLFCNTRAEAKEHSEPEDDDDEVKSDDTDDDDEDGGRCPRPGPRKGRGGRKRIKAKQAKVEISVEDSQEMRLIIAGSNRKSLTGKSAGTADATLPNGLPPRTAPGHNKATRIVYQSARDVFDLQDKWIREKALRHSEAPDFSSALCSYQQKQNHFSRQLYVEHLNWASIAVMDDKVAAKSIPVSRDGVLAWVRDFQEKFGEQYHYTTMMTDAKPNSMHPVDMALKMATSRVLTKLEKVMATMLRTRSALVKLIELVRRTGYDKRNICMEFEQVHEDMGNRAIKFDETTTWGVKPIRLALEPPYFKSEDGMMAAPMAPETVILSTSHSTCFFKRDKQKWTTKDLDQLKICIKEVLCSKRLHLIENKYDTLMTDCMRKYENQLSQEGRLNTPSVEPLQKGRRRTKKSELQLTSKYGIIYPVFCVLPNGLILRSEVSPRRLEEWRSKEEKTLNSKTYEELVALENENIDWDAVSNKMIIRSRKNRSPEDCELAWRHEARPRVNNKRWGKEESERLADIYKKKGNNWVIVAKNLNSFTLLSETRERTPYQCFFRIRNKIAPPKKIDWNKELDDEVLEKLQEHPGNWRIVAASVSNPAATKRQCIERYKKTINPVLRSGPFTRVEDCLLILTIEKLKPFLAREGHFGCLLSYLPWRCETTWRDRANNLFSDWIVPWTLEEDKMLLELAETMNRNWQQISEEFTSFKNRKGCLTRFKILKARLADERFNNSLEAYHEAYAMTRYNVFQYKHLKDVLTLLQRVRDHPLPPEHRSFVGLLRDEKPSEVRLQHMLLCFDITILNSTIAALSRYIETRDNYWRKWIDKHGKRKRTFDRRTFHPDNPQSVASALHIQGLQLKNKEDIQNLSDFEEEVYKFYGRFCRTKALKPGVKRPYIPDAKTLAQWSVVSRLIATPLSNLKDEPMKRKWRTLQTDTDMNRATTRRRGKQQAEETVEKKVYKKRGPKPKPPSAKTLNNRIQKRKYTSRKPGPVNPKKTVATQSTSDGYLLVPEASVKMGKQGRKRVGRKKKEEDADPEFIADSVKAENAKELSQQANNTQLRRSTRASTRRYVAIYDEDDIE